MSKSKQELIDALVKEKVAAGLTPKQALDVATAQVAHDEALASADAETAAATEKAEKKKTEKKA